jgi:hypothetical protein
MILPSVYHKIYCNKIKHNRTVSFLPTPSFFLDMYMCVMIHVLRNE